MGSDDIVSRLNALFVKLDEAALAPATILKSVAHKERYESYAMFAFRKLQAARYHRRRVPDLLQAERQDLERLQRDGGPQAKKLKVTASRIGKSRSADEFGFELSAFFAAIRSSIDFLVVMRAHHMKGVQTDSIGTLLKMIGKGMHGPILRPVAAHAGWLQSVRDYRDYVVHRLVLRTTSDGQVEWRSGKSIVCQYPVVVPSSTPQHVPDTRLSRAQDEPESRFVICSVEGSVMQPDGTSEVFVHRVDIEPGHGSMRIEALMQREMTAFERFFADVADALIVLDFAPSKSEATVSKVGSDPK